MNKNVKILSTNYKCKFMTTSMIENDIKNIKKINILFKRYEKFNNDKYLLEIINILKMLNNVIHLNNITPVFLSIIDEKYFISIIQIINEINDEH